MLFIRGCMITVGLVMAAALEVLVIAGVLDVIAAWLGMILGFAVLYLIHRGPPSDPDEMIR